MQKNSHGTESKSLYENAKANCIYYKTYYCMSRPSIFDTYDPLIKAEPVFITENINQQEILQVRPVWIIGDLKTLHNWMNAPLRKSNWYLDTQKKSLFRHYKQLLRAKDSQSFMIEQNELPIIQFDILTNPIKKWGDERLTHGDDCLVNFLFVENFRKPDLFREGFECLAECVRSLSAVRYLYVYLPQADTFIDAQLRTIGFESIRISASIAKKPWFYRLKITAH